ncbi:MAG: aspartate kinase [Bacteroidales bacterium]|nr:aspartate kinase [Bacteroidales bacterium]
MNVYKFGGASVNSAQAVRNVASIVRRFGQGPLVVVVSAMGKTTNQLELLVPGIPNGEEQRKERLEKLRQYHEKIAEELFPVSSAGLRHPVFKQLDDLFSLLDIATRKSPTGYNFDYDQTVCFGELISTVIVAAFLKAQWVDVRGIIRTDANYREGHVDWEFTHLNVEKSLKPLLKDRLVVTQGFIAGAPGDTTSTLGREGSDYTAAILSHCLDAKDMTIWKDVPGFLNADPKFFRDTVKMNRIPYSEAIELAYYGASVIHPKTVQPIQNKNIALHIRSFVTPDAEGSIVGPYDGIDPQTPLYIFRNDQVLLSILPRDFSFVAEDNLQVIFAAFARLGVRINLMQNSALSFSVCVDHNEVLLAQLRELLGKDFRLRHNAGLQLVTIRYYTQDIIDRIVAGRPVLLEQRSRATIQLVVGW